MLTTENQHEGIVIEVGELLRLRNIAKDFALAHSKSSNRNVAGQHSSRSRGRGMSFAEVRHYQAGDDVRNIDWRVTARTQRTHTKLFEEEKERPVYILLDQRRSMYFGSQRQFKSVLAAKLAALACWSALSNNDRIGAFIVGSDKQTDMRAKQGKHAALHVINHICRANQTLHEQALRSTSAELTLSDMLEQVLRTCRPGSLVYVISDFHDLDERCERSLALLRRHNELSLLHISDPIEHSLPSVGAIDVCYGDEQMVINSNSKKVQTTFSASWTQQLNNCEQIAVKFRCPLAKFSTHQSVNEQLNRGLALGMTR